MDARFNGRKGGNAKEEPNARAYSGRAVDKVADARGREFGQDQQDQQDKKPDRGIP